MDTKILCQFEFEFDIDPWTSLYRCSQCRGSQEVKDGDLLPTVCRPPVSQKKE
jgi:hypothetical protein